MNICITPASAQLFAAYFKKKIGELYSPSISANDLLKKLFDSAVEELNVPEITSTRKKEVILQHLSLAPQVVKEFLSRSDINNKALSEQILDLQGKIYAASQSEDPADFQHILDSLGKMVGNIPVIVPTVTEIPTRFEAISFEFFKTINQEMIWEEGYGYSRNIIDPTKQFPVIVQRSVIISGNKNNLRLQLLTKNERAKYEDKATSSSKEAEKSLALIFVDQNGEPVKFDENGNVSKEGNIPVMYTKFSRADFTVQLNNTIEYYVNKENMSFDVATQKATAELNGHLKMLDNSLSKLQENKPVFFSIDLSKSNLGFVELNLNKKVALSSVTNVNELNLHVVQGAFNYFPGFNVPLSNNVSGTPYSLFARSANTLTDKELDIIAELIHNNKLEIEGVNKEVFKERKRLLGSFFDLQYKPKDVNYQFFLEHANINRKHVYYLHVGGVKYDLADISKEQVRDIIKEFINKKWAVPYTGADVKNITPAKSFEQTTDENSLFYNESGKLMQVVQVPRSFNISRKLSDLSTTFTYPVDMVDGKVILAEKSHKDHIIENGLTMVQPNAAGEIRGYSSYLSLASTPEDIVNDYLSQFDLGDEEIVFQSLADQNKGRVSLKEEKDAEDWFKNSPLSKVISLNYFDQLHERGKSYVAEFVRNSINLYLGSDKTAIYHEAFHAYFRGILSSTEQKEIYDELRKTPDTFNVTVYAKKSTVSFAEATDLQLEEYLAEQFRSYAQSKGTKSTWSDRVTAFFAKLYDVLKRIFGSDLRYSEAVAMNKMQGYINEIFDTLYTGNFPTDKFTSLMDQTQLFSSKELSIEDRFSLQEVSLVMDSMKSLMTDFIQLGVNASSDRSVNNTVIKLLMKATNLKTDSEEYGKIMAAIEQLNAKSLSNGYGIFAINQQPILLKYAMDYIKGRLGQQLMMYKSMKSSPSTVYAIELLDKTIKNFGTFSEIDLSKRPDSYLDLTSLFLFEHSNINLGLLADDEMEGLSDEQMYQLLFDRTGAEKSLMEVTDAQTKQLLSSIHAYSNNGKGVALVNALGVKQIQPFHRMLAKTARLLRNTIDAEQMYEKLELAAQTDHEIAQVLLQLGNIYNPNITLLEQKQWLAFWQVMNKADVFLREFILERKIDTESGQVSFESRSGKSKTEYVSVGREWQSNFSYISHESPYFVYDALKKTYYLVPHEIAEDYSELGFGKISGEGVDFITSKNDAKRKAVYTSIGPKGVVSPFEFLKTIGIDLVDDSEVRNILQNGDKRLGIDPGIVDLIFKSMVNRQTALRDEDKTVDSLNKLFNSFSYRNAKGEVEKQISLQGWYKQLQLLQYIFSDDSNSFVSYNAEGEKQSEKVYNSSLTSMVSVMNNAESYDELISTPGMEHFDYMNNPFVASNKQFVAMFNLDSADRKLIGTRNKNIKFSVEALSGSKIIFNQQVVDEETGETSYSGTQDKGVASINSDERTKFISDFHLTLEGKQEILRSEAKRTSLIVSAPVKKRGVISRNELEIDKAEVEEIFTSAYDKRKSSILLYNEFEGHLEAELVRIARLNDVVEDIASGEDTFFDAAYLNRGRKFFIFDNILSKETKQELLSLGVANSFGLRKTISSDLKKKIDSELKAYFELKAANLRLHKGSLLTISDNLFDRFKVENETIDETTEKMYRTFVINNFLQNANYGGLFIGDPALYNVSAEDYHKRIAGLISTGKLFAHHESFIDFMNSSKFETYGFSNQHNAKKGKVGKRNFTGYLNTGIMKEAKSSSIYLKQYSEDAGIDVKEYKAMKEADGAGWISFDAYRALNLASNEWSDQQEKLYKQMLNGEDISLESIRATFPVRKFQYYGPVTNENAQYGLAMMAFHKYSLMPLIPALIEGKPLGKLHEMMMEQGMDYVTMQSGSKVSSITKVVQGEKGYVADVDNVYTDTRTVENIPFTMNQIHLKYLKNQVFIAEGFKGKVTLGSQKRKIILNGLMSDGIPTDFMRDSSIDDRREQWNALKESAKEKNSPHYTWFKNYMKLMDKMHNHVINELLYDIGLSYNKKGELVGDSKNLVSYLQKQMEQNDLLPEDVEFIVDENGNLRDLSLSMYSEKLESLLVTLADKKLRRWKVTGEAFVQVPGTMFESQVREQGADNYQYGTNDLAFYHLVDEKTGQPKLTENGSWIVKSMEVRIAMQGSFKNLYQLKHPDDKKIAVYRDGKLDNTASLNRLNEALRNAEWKESYAHLLQLQSDRIPTQGPNALESITVAEFLPEWAGPIIILPAEIVAKAGSDYDIDKMYAQLPNIVRFGDSVELQKYIESDESSAELYAQVKVQRAEVNEAQKAVDDLYKERVNFYKQSNAISTSVKKQYFEMYELTQSIYKTKNELEGHLKAALNNLWNYKGMSSEERFETIADLEERIANTTAVITAQEADIQKFIEEVLGMSQDSFFKESTDAINKAKAVVVSKQETLEKTQRLYKGKSIKGLENEFLELMNQRILMPNNFSDLITANSTDIAEPLSREIEKILNDKNKGKKYSKYSKQSYSDAIGISPTTIYDYEYNLSKHQENSVGFDSLGIAAVTATFYAIFTTFGAKLNSASPSEQAKFEKSLRILNDERTTSAAKLMAQKELLDFKNHTIKLNHNSIVDASGKHISLSNFNNIDGQSIANVISQLINGFVDVAKDAWVFNIQGNKENTPILLFMVMAGASLKDAVYLSSSPLVMEYNRLKKEYMGVYANLSTDPKVDLSGSSSGAKSYAKKAVFDLYEANFKAFGYDSPAYGLIANKNTNTFQTDELRDLIKSDTITDRHIEALAEYLLIEEMADDVTAFTQLNKHDTQQLSALADAQKRLDDTRDFKSLRSYIPGEWFGEKGVANTPVGKFNNDQFVIDLFERYAQIRNSSALVKASLKLPKTERLALLLRNDFKNDFIWFLFQNAVYSGNTYNGYTLVKSSDPNVTIDIDEENKIVTYGSNVAFSVNNFDQEFNTHLFNESLGVRFRIEYEKLGALSPEELKTKYSHLDFTNKRFTANYLRFKAALYESRNPVSFFSGPTGVANIISNFKQNDPTLVEQYEIFRDLRYDVDVNTRKSNLYLNDINIPEMRKIYKENIKALITHPNKAIAEFFGMFDLIAVMQTGMNRSSKYDLGKLVDPNFVKDVIDKEIGIDKINNELKQIAENILENDRQNAGKPKAERSLPNMQLLGQFKDMFNKMAMENLRLRAKGIVYVASELSFGKSVSRKETLLSYNNVRIITDPTLINENETLLDTEYIYEFDSIDEAIDSLIGKKIAIANAKIIIPTKKQQSLLNNQLLNKLGIDNSGTYPTLRNLSKTKREGFLSIAGLGSELKQIHSVKDEFMANKATKAIGFATIANEKYKSSAQLYISELEKSHPGSLSKKSTAFSKADTVWIFGSGIFPNAYRNTTREAYEQSVENTFNTQFIPVIDKAMNDGVSTFVVGTASGIDKLAQEHLEKAGYIKVPVYAYTSPDKSGSLGKYYEFRKAGAVLSDLNFNPTEPIVTFTNLGFSKIYDEMFLEVPAWFKEIESDEKLLAENGQELVYQKIREYLRDRQQTSNPFLRTLAETTGPIRVGDSLLSSYVELALYKLRDEVVAYRAQKAGQAIGNSNQVTVKGKKLTTRITLPFTQNSSVNNVDKIFAGTKTTTIRNENVVRLQPEQIGISVLTSNTTGQTQIFGVTLRGLLDVNEAGGAESMLKSEGVSSADEFMYDNSREFIEGKRKMYVYDIVPLYNFYTGDLRKEEFVSLSLEEQVTIIEQQKNC